MLDSSKESTFAMVVLRVALSESVAGVVEVILITTDTATVSDAVGSDVGLLVGNSGAGVGLGVQVKSKELLYQGAWSTRDGLLQVSLRRRPSLGQ